MKKLTQSLERSIFLSSWKPNDKIRFIKDLEFHKREYEKLGENGLKKRIKH